MFKFTKGCCIFLEGDSWILNIDTKQMAKNRQDSINGHGKTRTNRTSGL